MNCFKKLYTRVTQIQSFAPKTVSRLCGRDGASS